MCVCVCVCVCVCARARARALQLYGVAPSPAVTTVDRSIAGRVYIDRNGLLLLLLLLLVLLLLLLRVFVADDRSYNIDALINSNCGNGQRN